MSDPTKAEDWIAKAEEDLAIALPLLRRKKLMTYGITFHAQQCAEKYLKALVVKQGVAPIKTHDLVQVAAGDHHGGPDLVYRQGFGTGLEYQGTVDLAIADER